ncbi:hypothetical protein ABU614_21975 [Lysobacter firmicutimachus]|uniref:Helix-turn-helix domain-containing protein n=1 Tax=Lysobacter firmicutimachus TaxID=1792846 RepID=A0AAU8MV21_9GAMM
MSRKSSYRNDPCQSMTVELALRVAIAFRYEQPTPLGLQQRFGMCRSTAYRWIQAWKQATGTPSFMRNQT